MNASTYRSAKIENRNAVLEAGRLTVFQDGEIIAFHSVDGLTPGQIWALVNAPLPVAEEAAESFQVDVPGVFAAHMEESSVGTGADDADADSKATRLALEAGEEVKVERRYVVRIVASKGVMRVLRTYAEAILSGGGEWMRAEVNAAQRMVEALDGATALVLPAEGNVVEWRKEIGDTTIQTLVVNGRDLGYVVFARGRWQGRKFESVAGRYSLKAPVVTWAQTADAAKARLVARLAV